MIKPDVITCSPYSLDYPLWRQEMERYRDKFGYIINSFYNDSRRYDLRDFVIGATPWAISLDWGYVRWRLEKLCCEIFAPTN